MATTNNNLLTPSIVKGKVLNNTIKNPKIILINNPDIKMVNKLSVNKKTRIVITGPTSFLASNFIFELCLALVADIKYLEVYLLGRSKGGGTLKERVESQYFGNEAYLPFPSKHIKKLREFFTNSVKYIDFELTKDNLGLNNNGLEVLIGTKIDYFLHIAALPDLRIKKIYEKQINEVNVNGTKNIIKLMKRLSILNAIYVGTAYVAGKETGVISPNTQDLNREFNNAYEKSKLEGEILFTDYCKTSNIQYQAFRPSVICGRLSSAPYGAVNKYDVFYQFCLFFLAIKMKQFNASSPSLYTESVHYPIRMFHDIEGSLNIVPVDYIARLMVVLMLEGKKNEGFHLTNPISAKNTNYIPFLLKYLKIEGVVHVASEPLDKTKQERIYYEYCGDIFRPYLTNYNQTFDLSNLTDLSQKYGIVCPRINDSTLNILLSYASNNHFGLVQKKANVLA